MLTSLKIPAHVDCGHVIKWLHDHVGACGYSRDRYSLQGYGWRFGSVANWSDHGPRAVHIQGVVDFEDHVSPDVITQFMLTWS